jgi:3'-phosphoadenosine 5'-phosphosulfate sulfotransferase (PAPS reductase)/FAD synthetase
MLPIIDKWTTFNEVLTNHEDFTYSAAGEPSLGDLALSSIKAIHQAIIDGWTIQANCSFGKDSLSTLSLFLMALMRAVRSGQNVSQHHFILHANTGIENPEVQHLADQNIQALNAFIERHQLPLTVLVATPSFTQSWVGRILTGRGLPTFANSGTRQCTIDLKISGANRARKAHLKKLPKEQRKKVCLLLGSRDDEGAKRAASIKRFGGQADAVTVSKDGGELYPVKSWSTENIWEFLLSLGDNKPLPCFTSSLVSTAELYKEATGECIWSTQSSQPSSACGARFGCFACQAGGEDKSMTNLLQADDTYAYMKPLNRIQKLIANTRYDWSKRNPVGRTIYEGGFIRWQPDVYSVDFTEKLLRACISADYMEAKRASRMAEDLAAGRVEDNAHNRRMSAPQFRIVSDEQIIMVDFVWSLHNFQSIPFRALEIYKSVWEDGQIDDLSEVDTMEPVPRSPMPAAKWVHVGTDWLEHAEQGGLVDNFAALAQFDTDVATWTKPVKTSQGVRELIAAEETADFQVDMESAYFILNFEYDRLIERARSGAMTPAAAAHYYLRLGVISLAKGKMSLYDNMAARGQRYRSLGISGQQSFEQPPTHLKVLSNTEYKRYVKRINVAGVKRLKWWAFMGFFVTAHMEAPTLTGQFLRNQLQNEEAERAAAKQASFEIRYKDALANVLNTQALVALGALRATDPFAHRQTAVLMDILNASPSASTAVVKRLRSLKQALDSNKTLANAPEGIRQLMSVAPSAMVVIVDNLLASMRKDESMEVQLQLVI